MHNTSQTFQSQLAQDKLAGFNACKSFIESDGIVMAKVRVRADVLPSNTQDVGFWRGWIQALLSDSLVGA